MNTEPIEPDVVGRRTVAWQFTLRTLLFVMFCVGGALTGFQCGYRSGAESRRQELFTTRVYPVADVMVDPDTKQPNLAGLIALIEQSIDAASWDTVGGPGSASGTLDSPAIVIAQSGTNHDAIARLLSDLRKAKESGKGKAASPDAE